MEFRRRQLRKLLMLMEENEDEICEALAKDMRKVCAVPFNLCILKQNKSKNMCQANKGP